MNLLMVDENASLFFRSHILGGSNLNCHIVPEHACNTFIFDLIPNVICYTFYSKYC